MQSLKYSDHSHMMVACRCGDMFHAEGTTADVDAKHKEWSRVHVDCTEKKREGAKVFWLSFCDSALPKGSQFIGGCVVKVTAEEADEAAFDVMLQFPFAQPDAEWIAAACKKAHQLGCNPGGEMASIEIDADNPMLAHYTFGVLMDKATIEAIDRVMEMP